MACPAQPASAHVTEAAHLVLGVKLEQMPVMPVLCLQVLAEKLAERLPIRHGIVVDHIDWGGEGVTLHCQGGEQVQADAVIVTVSLGVLKVMMLLQCNPAIMRMLYTPCLCTSA